MSERQTSSAYRRRTRARVHRRRRVAVLASLLAIGALAWILGSGGSSTRRPPVVSPVGARTPTIAVAPRRHAAGPSPGSLPQTQARPPAGGAELRSEMSALWRGIVTGSVSAAQPALFPEGAYAQVKAYADPRSDYTNRLVRNYSLDLAAAHDLVRTGGRLIRVDVPAAYAHWVPPGACYNRVGYYEVPNSRLVYEARGQVRSLGIASMISWRGVWYVIHLGAINGAGVVDDPQLGPGTSVASSTC